MKCTTKTYLEVLCDIVGITRPATKMKQSHLQPCKTLLQTFQLPPSSSHPLYIHTTTMLHPISTSRPIWWPPLESLPLLPTPYLADLLVPRICLITSRRRKLGLIKCLRIKRTRVPALTRSILINCWLLRALKLTLGTPRRSFSA